MTKIKIGSLLSLFFIISCGSKEMPRTTELNADPQLDRMLASAPVQIEDDSYGGVFTLDVNSKAVHKARNKERVTQLVQVPPKVLAPDVIPPRPYMRLEGNHDIKKIAAGTMVKRSCAVRSKPTNNSAPLKNVSQGTNIPIVQFNKEWRKFENGYIATTCFE